MKYETYKYANDENTVKLEFSLPAGDNEKKEAFLSLLILASKELEAELE